MFCMVEGNMLKVNGFKNIPPRETYRLVREENNAVANEQIARIREAQYTEVKQNTEQKKLDIKA